MIGREGSESEWLRLRVAESPILKKHVHWLGFRSDVASLLKTADVLVLPSLWEGMPNVVLEAMASNLAVIGTDVEGTNELIHPGETGWLVAPESETQLADALLEAAEKPDFTKQLANAGRQRVESFFTLRRTIEAYDRLWTKILGYREN
jgi:glycosyltransferase involved in cell wall biosynthesis